MGASRLRMLLAESGLTETELALRSLCVEWGRVLELVRVESGAELEQALRAHCPDIALLKLSLLQPEAARQLRVLQENSPSIPFILLTEPADNVSAETCHALGAADYLVEGYMDKRTMNRVLSSAMEGRLALAWSAELELGPGWTRPGRQEWMFTVTLGDTERMRDWLGGPEVAGRVFGTVAEVVRKCVRSTDDVEASTGGELVVRMRNLDKSRSARVQKRIEERLKNTALLLLQEWNLTIETRAGATEGGLQFAVVPSGGEPKV